MNADCSEEFGVDVRANIAFACFLRRSLFSPTPSIHIHFLPRSINPFALPKYWNPSSHSSPTVALAALRQKQAYEAELSRIAGTRLTLEAQVNAIETANLNAETMVAMKKGAEALKGIHGSLCVA